MPGILPSLIGFLVVASLLLAALIATHRVDHDMATSVRLVDKDLSHLPQPLPPLGVNDTLLTQLVEDAASAWSDGTTLQRAVDLHNLLIWKVDAEQENLVVLSQGARGILARYYGLTPDDIVGTRLEDWREGWPTTIRAVQRCLETGEDQEWTTRGSNPAGPLWWARCACYPHNGHQAVLVVQHVVDEVQLG